MNQKCYVRMYVVGGQELATTGEVEEDVQLGTEVGTEGKCSLLRIFKKKGS